MEIIPALLKLVLSTSTVSPGDQGKPGSPQCEGNKLGANEPWIQIFPLKKNIALQFYSTVL